MTLTPIFQQQLEIKRKAVLSARKALEKAKKHLETVESELRGWEEAAKAMGGTAPSVPPPALASASRRGLSDRWKVVLGEIAKRYPDDMPLADIVPLAGNAGLGISADTLRGQMHHYADVKILERTAPGRFRIAKEGAAAIGIDLNADDEDIPF